MALEANSSNPESYRTTGAVFRLVLAALLSLIAGMADAIGFSQTGEFVSFMSGNTTRMGIFLSDGDTARGYRLLTVIVLFVAGNALAAILVKLSGPKRRLILMLYISALLAISAGLPQIAASHDYLGLEELPGFARIAASNMTMPSLVLLILAMAALNATVEGVDGVGLNLTYVTGALAKIGRGLGNLIIGDRRLGWLMQLVPWTGLVLGALLGNRLDHRFGRGALWLPFAIALLIALAISVLPKRWQRQTD